jgi:hypothetical protein
VRRAKTQAEASVLRLSDMNNEQSRDPGNRKVSEWRCQDIENN